MEDIEVVLELVDDAAAITASENGSLCPDMGVDQLCADCATSLARVLHLQSIAKVHELCFVPAGVVTYDL